MVTKRNALVMGILLMLLLTSACGGAPAATQPATEAPITYYIPQ
jgi:ABC-type glycerol-3-phosphate transport system substrate-binding protein